MRGIFQRALATTVTSHRGRLRAAVEQAMVAMPAPFGVSAQTAAVMALDSYPVSTGPPGSVDKVRLQRVVDVMRRFLNSPASDISSILAGGGRDRRATG